MSLGVTPMGSDGKGVFLLRMDLSQDVACLGYAGT